MRCPFCGSLGTSVLDSRIIDEGNTVKRRRECKNCGRRFSTSETIDEKRIKVIKKDSSIVFYDRKKIENGIIRACQKRRIPEDDIRKTVSSVEKEIIDRNKSVISVSEIGDIVLEKLSHLDEIAYVRFASVYKEFKNISDFRKELKTVEKQRGE